MVNGRISIIVPVYNAEKHLEDAIKSVLEQTYSEFELIAVNDCIFRKNCASVPEERSAIPLQTEQSSAG